MKATSLIPGLGMKLELGFDVSKGIPEAARNELRSLFNAHHLLFLELPELSSQQQLDLFETFGRVMPNNDGTLELIVSNVRSDGYLGTYELEWHTDGSYVVEPYLANCLYALDLQAGKSATRFVSAAAACERLPKELKDRIRYLQVINTNEIEVERGKRVATLGPDLAAAAHRFISRHPVTGIEYIGANSYQTDCVLGLDPDGSRALLQEVYAHLYAPEHVYEHWWKNGDLVIWDNLVVHHARGDMSNVGNRTLRRFNLGTASSLQQLPARQQGAHKKHFSARVGPQGRRLARE